MIFIIMGLNVNNKETYKYVDENNFITSQAEKTNPNKLKAYGDAIGHTTNAYIAYEYKPFVEAVKSCFIEKEDKKGKYIKAYRSPLHVEADDETMSRDHILYALALMKMAGEDEFLKKISNGLRWKISEKYSFTVESWLWMKGISGKTFYMLLYYMIDIPVMFFSVFWNSLVYMLGGMKGEVKQKYYVPKSESKKSKRLKKFRKVLYPVYALYLKALTLYVSPNSPGKWIMKKICLFEADKENYVIRLFLDAKVNKEDVYNYKSMYGGRWTTYLSDINDRYLEIITNPTYVEENAIDVDLVRKLYEENK